MGGSISLSTDVKVADPDAWKCVLALPLVGGGGVNNATQIFLGEATEGNNNFTSNTRVQDAIDDIDTILGLLAPAKPSNLSAVSLN